MDDDARAEPGWLQAIIDAFEACPGEKVCVGGRVVPAWERPRPAWLSDSMAAFLSLVDHGIESRPCDYPRESLVGCNIAFYRAYILGSGGFNPRLGRRGSSLLSNDDVDLISRLHAGGGTVYYEANAIVHHSIPAERLTVRWFLNRVYAQGCSDALWTAPAGNTERSRPKERVRSALSSVARLDPSSGMTMLLVAAYAAGRARGAVSRRPAR
jgi:hypothetical protein